MEYKVGDKVIIANNLKEIDERLRKESIWTPYVIYKMTEMEGVECTIQGVSCNEWGVKLYHISGSIYAWIEEYFIPYVQPEVASDDDINLLIGG